MPDPTNNQKQFSITRDPRISARVALPTLSTIISTLIIAFLIYAFVSGLSFQFYASFLFLFYGITKTMWVSVMLLGLFQTLLMIPFRIIRVVKTNNIKEFQRTVERLEDEEKQGFTLKTRFREGNVTFLFYAVDFVMQLVSYVSIGRLFLTDFYSRALNPAVLYDWVPYPAYPIRDIFFKIPYPHSDCSPLHPQSTWSSNRKTIVHRRMDSLHLWVLALLHGLSLLPCPPLSPPLATQYFQWRRQYS